MNLKTILNLLPAVGPVIAAAPEFVAMFKEAVATLSTDDQEEAKRAYDLAISRAGDAHQRLADLVRKHGGG